MSRATDILKRHKVVDEVVVDPSSVKGYKQAAAVLNALFIQMGKEGLLDGRGEIAALATKLKKIKK